MPSAVKKTIRCPFNGGGREIKFALHTHISLISSLRKIPADTATL